MQEGIEKKNPKKTRKRNRKYFGSCYFCKWIVTQYGGQKVFKTGHLPYSLFSYIESVSTCSQKVILHLNLQKHMQNFQSYPGKSQVRAKPVVCCLLIDCKTREIGHNIVTSIMSSIWFDYLKNKVDHTILKIVNNKTGD